MPISKELLQIANQLDKYEDYDSPELDALEKAATTIGKSWSGSWLGYHSKIYYADFQSPPPGAVFNQEWGLQFERRSGVGSLGMGPRGDWIECDFDEVVQFIHRQAGVSTDWCVADSKEAAEAFEDAKPTTLSLVHASYNLERDKFLQDLVDKIESLKILTERLFIEYQKPSGQMISRDMTAIQQGLVTPPHIVVLSKVYAAKAPFQACKDLKKQIVSLANHIQNIEKGTMQEHNIGNQIFIGHGHSSDWREFKDFINDRLGLPWDEFNRVPVAGVTNIARLNQMLNQSCMAFLVMTAEDEQADGTLHARINVAHEAGLFQGRLGFEKAIILLEEGCEEFSNIEGLGQIRFPKGKISATFEEVRRVLEREGIIGSIN